MPSENASKIQWPWPSAVVCVCIGLVAGVLVARAAAAPAAVGLLDADKATLRAIIREEIQAAVIKAGQPVAAPASAPSGAEALAQLSPPERAAFDKALAFIDERIAKGSWTLDDRQRLRDGAAALPGAVRPDLWKPLLIALNDGHLQWKEQGEPF